MLLSLVLQLTATTDATLTAEPGRAAQALLLDWIGHRDPALAEASHGGSTTRPYTVSALRAEGGRSERVEEVHGGQRYALRFTTLTEPLSQLMLEVAARLPATSLQLGGATFSVVGVAADAQSHPWAGRSSYNELAQAHFLSISNPPRQVTLEFVTPTTFHHTLACASGGTPEPQAVPPTDGGQDPATSSQKPAAGNRQPATANRRQAHVNIPLPLPELVFGSLITRWNAFAPLTLPDEVRRYAQECLAISRYRLQTRAMRFGEVISVGFVGHCQYTALVRDPYWLRAVSLLAAYAFYSGVGQRTTVGMGQVYSSNPANALRGTGTH
jgi:CRISPR-associated endoribonuclease Cas6